MDRCSIDYDQLLDDLHIYYGAATYGNKSNKDVQNDFKWLMDNPLYREAMVAAGYAPDTPIDVRRIKICKVCKKPYYSRDKNNRSVTCNRVPYRRHKQDGTPFKSSEKGRSECWMINDNRVHQDRINKKVLDR